MTDLTPTYRVELATKSVSFIGYVPQENMIVEYWLERNYIWYTCPPKMGTSLGICPVENLNVDRIVPLGEL